MEVLSNTASGKAHGKIILIGEHAVVHNQPAIAIPFTSAKVEVIIDRKAGDSTMESLYHTGKIIDAPHTLDNLIETLEAVCQYFAVSTDNIHITINSDIPAERGMGSSAAVATALVRALFKYFSTELPDKLLHRFVSISEKIAHGNPSGLDAQVVSSNESVYFVRGQEAELFELDVPGHLVIADTGQQGETGLAVTEVARLVNDTQTEGKKLIKDLGRLTNKARKYIEEKDLTDLGHILNEAQKKLKNLTVSNDKLDSLIQIANDKGALGAKLTGGGRGGCMIALVEKAEQAQNLAESLLKTGAAETWIHPLGVNNNVN